MPLPPIFNVKLTNPQAVFPTKAHENDVGYDLTLIAKDSKISEMTTMFDTGVCILPPDDVITYDRDEDRYYVEIVPRSSLAKSGYILTNSVGIIDPEYQGTLKVVLTKIDSSMPDLTLPFKGVQLIIRRLYSETIFQQIQESTMSRRMNTSSRGDGGFGSSDLSMNSPPQEQLEQQSNRTSRKSRINTMPQ